MKNDLTILSFGAGQDSTAILVLLVTCPEFRVRWAPGRLIVLMSDTGNEHPETVDHAKWAKANCEQHEIFFHLITPADGFHTATWTDLKQNYRDSGTCGSKNGYSKTCSINLKQDPFYRYLEQWVAVEYGLEGARMLESGRRSPVKALPAFAAEHGRIRILIGFAAGEHTRTSNFVGLLDGSRGHQPKNAKTWKQWKTASIDLHFPLIVEGLDRKGCQQTIAAAGEPVPIPSNCMICPFLSLPELLLLYRTHPQEFTDWVGFEKAKLVRFADKGAKNFGVNGRQSLEDTLAKAELQFGHMSTAELREWRFNHSSCTAQY